MFEHIDNIFPVLLKTLSDHSDEVRTCINKTRMRILATTKSY